MDTQGYAGAGLSPTAHSCFTIIESLTYEEKFFLVDLYDFLWRGLVLWALCFFTHLLKSPILGHPNSSSQEELDSAPGLLRSGCSRGEWSIPVRNWTHNIQCTPGVAEIGLRLEEKSSAWQYITSVQKRTIQFCIPIWNTAARWEVQQYASLINFLFDLRTE